jgi:hypothetical protein
VIDSWIMSLIDECLSTLEAPLFGPPDPLDEVVTLFSHGSSSFIVRVPFPLLILDAVSWTFTASNLLFTASGLVGTEEEAEECLAAAKEIRFWLDNPEHKTIASKALALRQRRFPFPSIAYPEIHGYMNYLHQSCLPAEEDEVQVAMRVTFRRVDIYSTREYLSVLAHSGVDGVPHEVSQSELEFRVRAWTEDPLW